MKESLSFNFKQNGVNMNASLLMMKITNTDDLIKKYKEKTTRIFNKILFIFHSQGLIYQGDLFNGRDMIVWKEDRDTINSICKLYVNRLLISKNKPIRKKKSIEDSNNSKLKFTFNKENILNISFLCANKILCNLYQILPKTMTILKDHGVRLNFLLNYGELINGYVGEELKINEVYTGTNMLESERILDQLNSVYNDLLVFAHNYFYSEIDFKIKKMLFQCDIVKIINSDKNTTQLRQIHKVYFNRPKLESILKDSRHNLSRQEIINDRKNKLENILQYKGSLVEYITSDNTIELYNLKNLPTFLFEHIDKFFYNFQENKLNECIVSLRRIKKQTDYIQLNDEPFKKHLNYIENIIKEKINYTNNKDVLDVSYTLLIKYF